MQDVRHVPDWVQPIKQIAEPDTGAQSESDTNARERAVVHARAESVAQLAELRARRAAREEVQRDDENPQPQHPTAPPAPSRRKRYHTDVDVGITVLDADGAIAHLKRYLAAKHYSSHVADEIVQRAEAQRKQKRSLAYREVTLDNGHKRVGIKYADQLCAEAGVGKLADAD
jgi:hypothetical protein